MNCSPANLISLSSCFCGTSRKMLKQIGAYLMCNWANKASILYSAAAFHENDGLLRIFTSPDALTFTEVSESYLDSAPLRDPSIIFYSGKYWCAYTLDGGFAQFTQSPGFGLASSLDGKTWTKVGNILCGIFPNGSLTGPMWFIDPANGSLHITASIAPQSGTFFIYEMHPTNAGMTAWSTAVALTGAGFSGNAMIDGDLDFHNGTYYLWYKNDTTKYIELASSSAPFTGYTKIKIGDWAGWGHGNISGSNNGYESPCPLDLPGGVTRLFIDSSVGLGIYYSDSADYNTWSPLQLSTWNNPSAFTMSQPDVRLLSPPV